MEPVVLRPFPMGFGGAGQCQQWENRMECSHPCWQMGLQGLVQRCPKPLGSTTVEPSGNCSSLNILCCLMGQCWMGTLSPKTHTGRSSQCRCPSLQLTLPLGPPSHMYQPMWLMSLSILQCHFPCPLPAILDLPRLPWGTRDPALQGC